MPGAVVRLRDLGLLVLVLVAMIVSVLAVASQAQAQRGRIAPEAATGLETKQLVTASRFMVTAANPYAVKAGYDILKAGGSAADAAIAVQLVLNLVEPQSSGIGGGAFVVRHDGMTGDMTTYDGREKAPAAATPERFLSADGTPIPFPRAVNSGLSIGVPGTVRLLERLHRQHGRLAWAKLFEPAIKLARDGFEVSSRLHLLLRWFGKKRFTDEGQAYFFPGGAPLPIGARVTNEAFARTLELIARGGADAFYSGELARDIVEAVRGAPNFAGDMTLSDLETYEVIAREPVCVTYRGKKVCGMGPPSSGAHTVGQTLKLVEGFALGREEADGRFGLTRARDRHLIAEAQKLAYADRNRYLADPDFVSVPDGLLDEDYIRRRRALIAPDRAMRERPSAGRPRGAETEPGVDGSKERSGTSHISIVDEDGNAIAMTTTIEGAFGSGVFVRGFLLNNELTDFSFRHEDALGRAIANRVEGGKRPRSSMSPTIILNADGSLFAVLGSPGGSRIILYVIRAIVGIIDWGLNAQEVADGVNFGSRGAGFELEIAPESIWFALQLKSLGHDIQPALMTSGLHIIVRRDGRLEGGADPRREGIVMGE